MRKIIFAIFLLITLVVTSCSVGDEEEHQIINTISKFEMEEYDFAHSRITLTEYETNVRELLTQEFLSTRTAEGINSFKGPLNYPVKQIKISMPYDSNISKTKWVYSSILMIDNEKDLIMNKRYTLQKINDKWKIKSFNFSYDTEGTSYDDEIYSRYNNKPVEYVETITFEEE